METTSLNVKEKENQKLYESYRNYLTMLKQSKNVDEDLNHETAVFSELLENLYEFTTCKTSSIFNDLQRIFANFLESDVDYRKSEVIDSYHKIEITLISIHAFKDIIEKKYNEYSKLYDLSNENQD